MEDRKYMEKAIELARKGAGYVNPNPRVGAVIVKDGRIIGEGYHERYGELHAERKALENLTEDPKGATMYVTLEPCCHHGKQPPCTEAVIESGISKVIVGSGDPNPKVAGGGTKLLRDAGVEVTEGFMKEECDRLNPQFFKYITTGIPYVTFKYAMTMDGKIATSKGLSKWITGETARADVHKTRAENMAIMAGLGTIISDDPSLDVRDARGLSPIRVVPDTGLNTPLESKIVKTAAEENSSSRLPRTVIATASREAERIKSYEDMGVKVLTLGKDDSGRVDPLEVLKALGEMKIDSVLLEGGAEIAASFFERKLVDKVCCYVAPKIFAGADAKGPVGGAGVTDPSDAYVLKDMTVTKIGSDLKIEGEVEYCSQE